MSLAKRARQDGTVSAGRGGPWRARIAVLGCAGWLAVAGGLALAPVASAYTRGFRVVNLSGASLRLVNAGCAQGDCLRPSFPAFDSRPPDGARLESGLSQAYQAIFYFNGVNDTYGHYELLDRSGSPVGSFQVMMNVDGYGGTASECVLGSLGAKFRCDAGGDTISFLDPPGTVHDVPAAQGQAQGAVLKQLCADDSAAKCTFTPISQVEVNSPSHQVRNALINNTNKTQDTTVSVSDTVESSNSVDVRVSVETKFSILGQELKTTIEAAYGHTWTTSHEFTQSVTVHCAPHNRCAIFATQPMFRTTGDFTLTMGNTTWRLHDVSFDTPNEHGSGAYEIDSTPLTAVQRASLPRTFHVAKSLASRYTVPARVADRPPADARLRLGLIRLIPSAPAFAASRDAAAGPGGLTRADRILVTAVEPANRLVYPVKHVHIEAWVNGRLARRWMVARLPFDHSMALVWRLHAARSAGEVCVTLVATAPHTISARLRACTAGAPSRPQPQPHPTPGVGGDG